MGILEFHKMKHLGHILITNNATTLKMRDHFLIGTSPLRFMPVKVTATP